jgi:methyltransferase (TIGR00027 family)
MESQEGLIGVGKTALGIAQARAMESRRDDRLFDDPYADAFVAAAPEPVVDAELAATGVVRNVIHGVIVRTRFFDDYLRQACAAGCRQVVLLAAGLDTRGFRLSWPQGVRLFELDLPDVMAFKDRVLTGQAARPRCPRMAVPVDLRQDWETPLTQAGFTPTLPTAWLAEGLLMYLSSDEATRLLTTVGELSAPHSQLAFDHRHPLDALLSEARAIPALQPYTSLWKGGLGAGTLDWLTDHGWDTQAHDRDDYAASLGRPAPDPSSATLITAGRPTATRPRS